MEEVQIYAFFGRKKTDKFLKKHSYEVISFSLKKHKIS
jgi:hypothetical protein